MDPTDLSDAQLDQLADQLAGRLPSGTHGDRVVLSRRAFAAAVGGTLGASGLVALGVDPAAAQAAGQVGTSADPVDAFVYDLDVANALQSDLDAGGNALTNVESLSTDILAIENQIGSSGDFWSIGPSIHRDGSLTTSSDTYEDVIRFDGGDEIWIPDNATPAIVVTANIALSDADIRVFDVQDATIVTEQTNIGGRFAIGPTVYPYPDDFDFFSYRLQVKSSDGSSNVRIEGPILQFGIIL